MVRKIAVCLLLLFTLSGCLLVPFIDSFREMGMSADARRELLPKKVKLYYSYVQARKFVDMNQFLHPETKKSLLADLRLSKKTETVTKAEIDYLEYNDDDVVKFAEVHVLVDYFQQPYYVVKQRLEVTQWEFIGPKKTWVLRSSVVDSTY